ncbi:MAG: SseB family protein [Oscillospiraceae bacterium]|jgi:hypothetical protein|nr:SseB family protein [Oscillospiraceae bacterium]
MSEANTAVTNPSLTAAIAAMQREPSAQSRSVVDAEIKNARFLSPVTVAPRPKAESGEPFTVGEGTKIVFIGITNAEGVRFLPVFSDWAELKKWRDIPDEQTVVTTFDDLCAIVSRESGAGFVINPFGENLVVARGGK